MLAGCSSAAPLRAVEERATMAINAVRIITLVFIVFPFLFSAFWSAAAAASWAEIVSTAQTHAFDFSLVCRALIRGFIEEGGVFVVKTFQFDPLDFSADEPLNRSHVRGVFSHH